MNFQLSWISPLASSCRRGWSPSLLARSPRPAQLRAQSTLPRPPAGLSRLETAEDMRKATEWVTAFEKVHADQLPRDCLDISYSRSSGPGGQNVNKVSTKATVRLDLDRTRSWYAPYALFALSRSPHYTTSNKSTNSSTMGSLLVSASEHRTQPANLAAALVKIKAALVAAAKSGIVGETSEAQKNRVRGLVARDKKKNEGVKRERKDVKSGRRAGKGGWD